jgi:WD40 repeat protein
MLLDCRQRAATRPHSFKADYAVCSAKVLRSDPNYVVAAMFNGEIKMYDVRNGAAVRSFEGNCNTSLALRLELDSSESLLLQPGSDKCVRVWSIDTGELLQTRPLATLDSVRRRFSAVRGVGFCDSWSTLPYDAELWPSQCNASFVADEISADDQQVGSSTSSTNSSMRVAEAGYWQAVSSATFEYQPLYTTNAASRQR